MEQVNAGYAMAHWVIIGAGVMAVVVGVSKAIEPLIELGAALVVMAMLARPKPQP